VLLNIAGFIIDSNVIFNCMLRLRRRALPYDGESAVLSPSNRKNSVRRVKWLFHRFAALPALPKFAQPLRHELADGWGVASSMTAMSSYSIS